MARQPISLSPPLQGHKSNRIQRLLRGPKPPKTKAPQTILNKEVELIEVCESPSSSERFFEAAPAGEEEGEEDPLAVTAVEDAGMTKSSSLVIGKVFSLSNDPRMSTDVDFPSPPITPESTPTKSEEALTPSDASRVDVRGKEKTSKKFFINRSLKNRQKPLDSRCDSKARGFDLPTKKRNIAERLRSLASPQEIELGESQSRTEQIIPLTHCPSELPNEKENAARENVSTPCTEQPTKDLRAHIDPFMGGDVDSSRAESDVVGGQDSRSDATDIDTPSDVVEVSTTNSLNLSTNFIDLETNCTASKDQPNSASTQETDPLSLDASEQAPESDSNPRPGSDSTVLDPSVEHSTNSVTADSRGLKKDSPEQAHFIASSSKEGEEKGVGPVTPQTGPKALGTSPLPEGKMRSLIDLCKMTVARCCSNHKGTARVTTRDLDKAHFGTRFFAIARGRRGRQSLTKAKKKKDLRERWRRRSFSCARKTKLDAKRRKKAGKASFYIKRQLVRKLPLAGSRTSSTARTNRTSRPLPPRQRRKAIVEVAPKQIETLPSATETANPDRDRQNDSEEKKNEGETAGRCQSPFIERSLTENPPEYEGSKTQNRASEVRDEDKEESIVISDVAAEELPAPTQGGQEDPLKEPSDVMDGRTNEAPIRDSSQMESSPLENQSIEVIQDDSSDGGRRMEETDSEQMMYHDAEKKKEVKDKDAKEVMLNASTDSQLPPQKTSVNIANKNDEPKSTSEKLNISADVSKDSHSQNVLKDNGNIIDKNDKEIISDKGDEKNQEINLEKDQEIDSLKMSTKQLFKSVSVSKTKAPAPEYNQLSDNASNEPLIAQLTQENTENQAPQPLGGQTMPVSVSAGVNSPSESRKKELTSITLCSSSQNIDQKELTKDSQKISTSAECIGTQEQLLCGTKLAVNTHQAKSDAILNATKGNKESLKPSNETSLSAVLSNSKEDRSQPAINTSSSSLPTTDKREVPNEKKGEEHSKTGLYEGGVAALIQALRQGTVRKQMPSSSSSSNESQRNNSKDNLLASYSSSLKITNLSSSIRKEKLGSNLCQRNSFNEGKVFSFSETSSKLVKDSLTFNKSSNLNESSPTDKSLVQISSNLTKNDSLNSHPQRDSSQEASPILVQRASNEVKSIPKDPLSSPISSDKVPNSDIITTSMSSNVSQKDKEVLVLNPSEENAEKSLLTCSEEPTNSKTSLLLSEKCGKPTSSAIKIPIPKIVKDSSFSLQKDSHVDFNQAKTTPTLQKKTPHLNNSSTITATTDLVKSNLWIVSQASLDKTMECLPTHSSSVQEKISVEPSNSPLKSLLNDTINTFSSKEKTSLNKSLSCKFVKSVNSEDSPSCSEILSSGDLMKKAVPTSEEKIKSPETEIKLPETKIKSPETKIKSTETMASKEQISSSSSNKSADSIQDTLPSITKTSLDNLTATKTGSSKAKEISQSLDKLSDQTKPSLGTPANIQQDQSSPIEKISPPKSLNLDANENSLPQPSMKSETMNETESNLSTAQGGTTPLTKIPSSDPPLSSEPVTPSEVVSSKNSSTSPEKNGAIELPSANRNKIPSNTKGESKEKDTRHSDHNATLEKSKTFKKENKIDGQTNEAPSADTKTRIESSSESKRRREHRESRRSSHKESSKRNRSHSNQSSKRSHHHHESQKDAKDSDRKRERHSHRSDRHRTKRTEGDTRERKPSRGTAPEEGGPMSPKKKTVDRTLFKISIDCTLIDRIPSRSPAGCHGSTRPSGRKEGSHKEKTEGGDLGEGKKRESSSGRERERKSHNKKKVEGKEAKGKKKLGEHKSKGEKKEKRVKTLEENKKERQTDERKEKESNEEKKEEGKKKQKEGKVSLEVAKGSHSMKMEKEKESTQKEEAKNEKEASSQEEPFSGDPHHIETSVPSPKPQTKVSSPLNLPKTREEKEAGSSKGKSYGEKLKEKIAEVLRKQEMKVSEAATSSSGKPHVSSTKKNSPAKSDGGIVSNRSPGTGDIPFKAASKSTSVSASKSSKEVESAPLKDSLSRATSGTALPKAGVPSRSEVSLETDPKQPRTSKTLEIMMKNLFGSFSREAQSPINAAWLDTGEEYVPEPIWQTPSESVLPVAAPSAEDKKPQQDEEYKPCPVSETAGGDQPEYIPTKIAEITSSPSPDVDAYVPMPLVAAPISGSRGGSHGRDDAPRRATASGQANAGAGGRGRKEGGPPKKGEQSGRSSDPAKAAASDRDSKRSVLYQYAIPPPSREDVLRGGTLPDQSPLPVPFCSRVEDVPERPVGGRPHVLRSNRTADLEDFVGRFQNDGLANWKVILHAIRTELASLTTEGTSSVPQATKEKSKLLTPLRRPPHPSAALRWLEDRKGGSEESESEKVDLKGVSSEGSGRSKDKREPQRHPLAEKRKAPSQEEEEEEVLGSGSSSKDLVTATPEEKAKRKKAECEDEALARRIRSSTSVCLDYLRSLKGEVFVDDLGRGPREVIEMGNFNFKRFPLGLKRWGLLGTSGHF